MLKIINPKIIAEHDKRFKKMLNTTNHKDENTYFNLGAIKYKHASFSVKRIVKRKE